VYGRRLHPVAEPDASNFIQSAITFILEIDPDIIGFGGKARTTERITSALRSLGFNGEIGYWGADVGTDAGAFLRQHEVSEEQW
jgi:hypothetical protein